MARPLDGRIVVRGTLRAESAVHVGSGEEGVGTDLPLAQDGRGEFYVPGTSLAGVLRDWYRTAFGEARANAVWGFQERGGRRSRGRASLVVVDDARVTLPVRARATIRDGVGIDREWGVAAPHMKYDRTVLPAGTMVELRLDVELLRGEPIDEVRATLGHLLEALGRGEIGVGAARTRGLGRVRLQDLEVREQRLSDRAGVLSLLHATRPADAGNSLAIQDLVSAAPGLRPVRTAALDVEVSWEPVGPLMVKAGAEGLAIDSLPYVEPGPAGLALVLPGSSIKGALRSHAERIVRTVLDGRSSTVDHPSTERFLHQIDVPLVGPLFGAAARRRGRGATVADGRDGQEQREAAARRGGRGALSVADCFATGSLDQDRWAGVITADTPENARTALDDAGLTVWATAHHVAVDRWTGGAAKALLFSVLEPHAVAWEPIRLHVELVRVPDGLRRPAVALLLLTLEDLAAGRIPLGFGTNRGMGSVRMTGARLEASDGALLGLGAGEGRLELPDRVLPALDARARQTLVAAWQQWIESERRRA